MAVPGAVKNILHLIETWGPGGAETVCVELAAGLDRARYASTGAVMREGWVYDAMSARGLDPVIVRSGRGPLDLPLVGSLARVLRRRRIDIVQAHLLGASLYASLVGRLLRVPTYCTLHGTVDVRAGDRFAALKLRSIGACAERMIFVSESLRRHVIGALPISPARTAVIYNGVDPQRFSPRRTGALRAELGLAPEDVLVAAIGNVRPAKAYDLLLHVAANCSPDSRLRFAIIGEGLEPLMTLLRGLQSRLQYPDRVSFLGYREDVEELFNGIDIYLSTSRSEGFSLTTVQAMACGVPVVVTRSGGPEEIVTHGTDGLIYPVGDAGAIAEALRSLANEPALRARLGAAGRETVLRRFTLQRMVDGYTSLYEAAPPRST